MSSLNLKPTHAPVKKYYATLERFAKGHFDKEGNIRGAFEDLLKHCAHQFDWAVVPEYSIPRKERNPLSVDGALLDAFNLPRGYWEAKDEKDDLKTEMERKFEAGYPRSNILFQRPTRALLFQDGRIAFNDSIEDPQNLVQVVRLLFEWRQPDHDSWDRAVAEFSQRIPDIAAGALKLIEEERRTNKTFVERFAAFADLCRESINPDLKDEAVEEMLVQHLLTERIFRRIFDNPEFTRRNVIAAEIEKVIDSLTKRHFSRDAFLRDLDPFYKAIEEAASTTQSYAEKQAFLNKVYERFFQGFNRKQADTHGIVYTPQPIVDFMVRSVEEILKADFGRSLSDKDVHVLDPFVGTGNFITRVMREIKTSRLPHKYKEELHCNEVMLLPYYIASMNIEHAYLDATGEYESFQGICLVDTFELAELSQQGFTFIVEENTRRVRKQKSSPIRVIIGNPPYNANQHYENQNNRNRRYKVVSKRIADTYGRDSKATNKNTLADPYVAAFRWASDRIDKEGVIALVTNNSFIESLAADGVRRNLRKDFDEVHVLDLGGDVRRNPKLSGTTNNVFGIQVGVAITVLVRRKERSTRGRVFMRTLGEYWTAKEKLDWLKQTGAYSKAAPTEVPDNEQHRWLTHSTDSEFSDLVRILADNRGFGVFEDYSNGVQSNRDPWVFSFNKAELLKNARQLIEMYNSERIRWHESSKVGRFESFVTQDETRIKWCSKLLALCKGNDKLVFRPERTTVALYRPYTQQWLFGDPDILHRPGRASAFFSHPNQAIVITSHSQIPFAVQATDRITCLDVGGRPSQLFPFIRCKADGSNRRENITDWALAEFRSHYGQQSITKLNIFHYVYAMLHHAEYRARYAANLRRELPRIPFAPDFAKYAAYGDALMERHINYEKQREYPLERRETGKLNWRVEKMRLSKDKTQLAYNDFLTLSGIPPEVYEYRLGNRSALEWIIDQYCVSTDKRSGITNDPNREDDPEYIVRLIGQVVTVSLETVQLVKELSRLPISK